LPSPMSLANHNGILSSRKTSALAPSSLIHSNSPSPRVLNGSHGVPATSKAPLSNKRSRSSSPRIEVGATLTGRGENSSQVRSTPLDPQRDRHSAHTAAQVGNPLNSSDGHYHKYAHPCLVLLKAVVSGRSAHVIRVTIRQMPPPSRLHLPSESPSTTPPQIHPHSSPRFSPALSAVSGPFTSPYRYQALSKTCFTVGEPPSRDRSDWTWERHQGYAAGWEDALRSVEAGSFRVGGQNCKLAAEHSALFPDRCRTLEY
jgi:hypothetical protein